MRIGLIIYGSLDTISGGYLYDRQLVRCLQQQSDEVQLISLPWTRYGNHLLHNIDPTIQQQLRDSSFDLLLQDELNHPSLFWLNSRLQHHLSFPIVSIVHHLRSSEKHPSLLLELYRRIERQYLRTIDGFIFNSKTTRTAVADLLQKQKPHVIAYPAADHNRSKVDRALVKKRAHAPGPLRLIFVGNIIPRKGCHFLLRALTELPKESWQLEIVGDLTVDAKHVRQLKIQASASAISENIHWHGRLSDADLARLLTNSQLLVLPSTYEGFGIVYLEGMNHGLPAIATTSGAAHEIITDGVNGFLVPADCPAALAGHIQTLNDDRSLLAQQSLAALDRAQNHPSWEKSMAAVRQFLVEMIT
jgi:glycosyltransferase involved in cell wall biosynthesis